MATTPTGSFSIPIASLRTGLAGDAAIQSFLGVATTADAEKKINLQRSHDDLAGVFPRVVLFWPASAVESSFLSGGLKYYLRDSGVLMIDVCDVDQGEHDDEVLRMGNIAGVFIDRLKAIAAVDDSIPIESYTATVAPVKTAIEQNIVAPYWFFQIQVNWK